jgi:hypothetical protein
MNFGQAIEALKKGDKVARAGWNGKGMWLLLVKPAIPKEYESEQYMEFPSYRVVGFHEDSLNSWIGMKTADSKFVPWLASQTDILAEDWTIL